MTLHGQFQAGEVERVEVGAHPVSVRVAGQAFPEDEAQAKFSIPYGVAVALLRGRVSQAEFGPQVRQSREVLELLRRIELRPDEALAGRPGRRPAVVRVHLADGRVLTASAEVRRGDPERPLTPEEKKDKFLGLAGQVWGRAGAERLWAAVREIDQAPDVSAWAERCRGLKN
jgi:2-methylcitrate dehydratase PrpD